MFGSMFRNMPPVTKNLLILNLLFFLAKVVMLNRGIFLDEHLGMHWVGSPAFQPYQLITSIFMHGSITHLLLNMVGVVLVGAHLERIWGAKRYLIFYLVCGIGASLVAVGWDAYQVYEIAGTINPDVIMEVNVTDMNMRGEFAYSYQVFETGGLSPLKLEQLSREYVRMEVGASGALYGVLMAFALLFPNTEFMLLFPPIPIKAKWLALILAGVALYSGVSGTMTGIGHFAHLGGMVFGFIMIKIWQRDKSNFY